MYSWGQRMSITIRATFLGTTNSRGDWSKSICPNQQPKTKETTNLTNWWIFSTRPPISINYSVNRAPMAPLLRRNSLKGSSSQPISWWSSRPKEGSIPIASMQATSLWRGGLIGLPKATFPGNKRHERINLRASKWLLSILLWACLESRSKWPAIASIWLT